MSYKYRDKPTDKKSTGSASSRIPRQYTIGPRSKTMIEETTTSRQRALKKDPEYSPVLQRRYGSARYQRSATTDLSGSQSSGHAATGTSRYVLPRATPSETLSHDYLGSSSRDRSSPTTVSSTYGRHSPFSFEPSSMYSPSKKYVPSTTPYSSHLGNKHDKKGTSTGRESPLASKDKSTYSALSHYSYTKDRDRTSPDHTKDTKQSSQYSSTNYRDRERSTPSPDFSKRYDVSSPPRSSSASSSRDSSASSRKSSLGKEGRVCYIGGYSGHTSAEDSSSRHGRPFDSGSRRGSEPLIKDIRTPFIRSYSLRDRDYPSKFHQRQVTLERKSSLPAYILLREQRKVEKERRSPVPETVPEERSRKGSWLKSRKKSPESEKRNVSKVSKNQRSESSSPGSSKGRFSLSGRHSSSSEPSEAGTLRKKFSVPSKYFSSKETVGSRDSATSEGSTEMLESESERAKKKYSLTRKFSFRKRGSSTERGISAKSESAPTSPILDSPVSESKGKVPLARAVSVDAEHDRTFSVMIGRLKFWDKKHKGDNSRSRSQSPEEYRRRSESSPAEVEANAPARPPLPDEAALGYPTNEPAEKYSTLPFTSKTTPKVLTKAKSLDSGQEAYRQPINGLDKSIQSDSDKVKSWTKVEIVSKRVEKEVAELIKTAQEIDDSPRERRRSRYRKTAGGKDKIGFSKSMDAAVDTGKPDAKSDLTRSKVDTLKQTQQPELPRAASLTQQPKGEDSSDKLREKRRRRRLERERFFAGMSPSDVQQSVDSVDASLDESKCSIVSNGYVPTGIDENKAELPKPARLTLKVSEDVTKVLPAPKPVDMNVNSLKPFQNEPSPGDILSRYICEDDTSRTLLDAMKKKDERPHSICGGSLSPDEMKKFEDIKFSLARKTSSDEVSNLRPKIRWSSSSNEVETNNHTEVDVGVTLDRDLPLTVVAQASEVEKKVVVRSKTEQKGDIKPVRKPSSGGEERVDSNLKSRFRKKTSVVSSEKDKEKKDKERDKIKLKEKEKEKEREKAEKIKYEKEKLREERERKEKEKQKHKDEERERKERERVEKERKEREKQKLREEKHHLEEKEKQKEKQKKELQKREKEKRQKDEEKEQKLKEKVKKEHENKEKRRKESKKHKEKEEDESEFISENKADIDKSQDELPKEGAVSALRSVFVKHEPSKPLKPAIRYTRKNRPKTLAVAIAPEILKAAREQVTKEERYHDKSVVHDDSCLYSVPEMEHLEDKKVEVVLQPQETSQEEELKKTKKDSKKAHKLRKGRKGSTTLRPFGMMKTKSESNLNDRFEFIQVDISLDNEKEEREKKPEEKKLIELKPVSKVTIPPAVSQLISNRISGKRTEDATTDTSDVQQQQSGFDEGLEAFFGGAESNKESKDFAPKIEITSEDLDAISVQTTQHLKSAAEDKLHLKPKRRHASKANPVKSLRDRTDIRTETEPSPRIEKKPVTSDHPVIRRKKKKYRDPDNLWRRHTVDFAASALAGLASTEDFTKISLRKTGGPEKAKEQDDYRGTKPLMLIHIKGRRNIQTRLIEPCQKSFNSGDCYVLVTNEDLFAWVGKHANAIERAKVTEIASRIFTKRELDCKARDIVFIDEKNQDEDNLRAARKFWKVLNGDPGAEIRAADCLPKDEEYEKGVTRTNMMYKVHWTEPPSLAPIESMCGHLPQISLLDTKEVLVFDFGSELYVWNGQQSLSGQRKTVFALGKQLYDSPFKPLGIYDPIYPYGRGTDVSEDSKKCRPAWTLFARLHEKAETILFREKFVDWPDPTKIIKMKGHPSSGEIVTKPLVVVELKPCDPKVMTSLPEAFKGEVLEGVNVGRGMGVPTIWTGDYYKEGNLCNTVGLTVWHINEYRHYELPQHNHGHFHSGEGYVIRWAYFVMTDRIAKDRKSRCRSTVAGRVRTAYFFWQGNDCTVNEKGAAAVMAVELDEERGPQIRVTQGKEPPCFLNLFKGGMVIHLGKRDHVGEQTDRLSDTSTIRMYVLRNEEPGEGCLVQVRVSGLSLRSRGCLVLLLCSEGKLFVWYGSKALEETRKNALVAAKVIQTKKPVECNVENCSAISIQEVEEGEEPEDFLKALGGKKYYCSLLNDPSSHHFTPRLFELSSATGKFMASEVLCPSRVDSKQCPYPCLQEDLYTMKQPGLFLLDTHYELYVWEGWIPEDDIDSLTGTGKQRWDNDRKLAMQTAVKYAEDVGKRVSHRVFVVYAGLEPMSFKAAFPYWNDKPGVIGIQKQSGKQPGAKDPVSELLQMFTKDSYSLAELQQVPPPQGVDPAKLETYLSTNDFQEVFKMGKEDFTKLPGWKQQNLKKAAKLF